MKRKTQRRISRSFLSWLLFLVVIAFLATTVFLWFFQTNMARENAHQLLYLNIGDVCADVRDASDARLLHIAYEVKDDIEQCSIADRSSAEFSRFLADRARHYDLEEINCIDRHGIIKVTTYPPYKNYDMRSGEQSAEFMVLLDRKTEYVQDMRPVSYDSSISRKYGGVRLTDGGFVQVGYDEERSSASIAKAVVGATKNRHVGKGGCIIIADSDMKIVSDRNGNEGKGLDVTGLRIDVDSMQPDTPFEAVVYGEPNYCMYHETEGFVVLAVMPMREAALSRNLAVTVTTVMQIIVFSALFMLVYWLVRRLVVNNIHRINRSLAEITEGKLDTVVDVRSHREFDELSDDINSTVDTLKRYIAEAAARIDAELAFAKAIQHAALPSVFPPYPHRHEFDIFACMHTAREVGGDFYDFYFVDDDNLSFMVADVSGKGIPAAMFMMTSKTVIKSLAESGMDVGQVFTRANEKLCAGNDAGMFVTAWMGILNVKTGKVLFANAGHNPPLVKRGDGTFECLSGKRGLMLAGMDGVQYHVNELQLEPGDAIYLYTDGVTEAADRNGTLYGERRLRSVLGKHKDGSAQALCEEVKRDVDAFVGDVSQFDDITMLALKYEGSEERRIKELTIAATVENIAAVTEFVDGQLERLGCPQKARVQIDIAIDELFGNIAQYAYNPRIGEATVRVEVNEDPLSVVITFIDNGIPYDPLKREDPDVTLSAEERKIGGLGIYMVKKTMDDVTYEYRDGKNILTIKKNIG